MSDASPGVILCLWREMGGGGWHVVILGGTPESGHFLLQLYVANIRDFPSMIGSFL